MSNWWDDKISVALPPIGPSPSDSDVFPFDKPCQVAYWLTGDEAKQLKTYREGSTIPSIGLPSNGTAIGGPRVWSSETGTAGITRHHCGIDLIKPVGTVIKSCSNGTILRFRHFYQGTYALFIDCGDYIINYGEVNKESLNEYGLKEGDSVSAGQPIAKVGALSKSSMLHFEMYKPSLKGDFPTLKTSRKICNQRWNFGDPVPSHLLDPTVYLTTLVNRISGGKYDYILENYQCR